MASPFKGSLNVKSNVPDESEDLLAFGLVLLILIVGIIWLVNSVVASVGNLGQSLGSGLSATGEGVGQGLGNTISGFFKGLLPSSWFSGPPPSF